MQGFDTFCEFLHKLHAATMDGVERAHIFFITVTGGTAGGQGIGHRGQLPPVTPLALPMSSFPL